MQNHSSYYNLNKIENLVLQGEHRAIVGGMWNEIGALQIEFLKHQGLAPDSRLLDIGCGCLRLGLHAVDYLFPEHYWGTDLNPSLLDAGYEKEIIPNGLDRKLPKSQLLVDSEFSFHGLPKHFDFAIAQSLFTHLPINYIRLCLANLDSHINGDCIFFATFFIVPKGYLYQPCDHLSGITTWSHKDPYHYSLEDIYNALSGLSWKMDFIGDWNHPRGQKMIAFKKDKNLRRKSIGDAANLRPGDDHYRAYVGPPERYDYMSASQFALLFSLGIREYHKVLDFGCGSLRLGRLLIPFLLSGNYYGIEPNNWLIEEALDRETGRDILNIKRPLFSYNDNFNTEVFSEKFDFIVAQSILTHAGPDLVKTFLNSSLNALKDGGLLLFSYLKHEDNEGALPQDGWHYPHCISYSEQYIIDRLVESGLHGRALKWHHPGANWIVASLSVVNIPESMCF